MNAAKNRAETSRKPRPSKSRRVAEFPAVTPPEPAPPLFTRKPLDQKADVRIGAVVRTSDGREGTVKALGAHRVRLVFADGRPPAVLLRGQLASMVAPAPAAKATRKSGSKALMIAADAPVIAIADALVGWDIPRERLLEALRAALAKLEG